MKSRVSGRVVWSLKEGKNENDQIEEPIQVSFRSKLTQRVCAAIFATVAVLVSIDTGGAEAPYIARAAGSVTFNKDIAPIIFKACAHCHQAGQAAPFELL